MRTRLIGILLGAPLLVYCQLPDSEPGIPTASGISNARVLGIVPLFQAVTDPASIYTPLRVRDKFRLFVKESVDPYTFASAAAGAALSQWHNTAPEYGEGAEPYLQRFGAAQADVTTQNFFSDALLASVLHEDPRYFREGPAFSLRHRIGYALSRVVVGRRDSGGGCFNYAGIGGMGLGIALSNAYYPSSSVSGGEMESRVVTSLTAVALGNLLPEFWPDFKAKLDHLRHH